MPQVKSKVREERRFVLTGRVTDQTSSAALPGVKATIFETNASVETDGQGNFRFDGLSPGEYRILFEKDGFVPYLARIQGIGERGEVQIAVSLEGLRKEIIVTADASLRAETIASSRLSLTGAQLRSLPGTFEDVSRALQAAPGVASSGDFKNDLIVRGGSPAENLFIVDRIRVPGLSHFGSQNSSGGALGVIDTSLIQEIEFYSGGFPACYGDTLSSVTHVLLREGDRDRVHGALRLSVFGLSGMLEGPLFSDRGSWIFSLRKDYFSTIPRNFTLDMTVVPDFFDGQAKLVFDLSKWLQLSVLAVGAQDELKIEEDDEPPDKRMRIQIGDHLYVYGATLRALLGRKGAGHLTLSKTDSRYSYALNSSGLERYTIRSEDQELNACLDLEYAPVERLQLTAGIESGTLKAKHHVYYRGGYIVVDRMGYRFTRKTTDAGLSTDRLAFYFQASYPITAWLRATAGLRGDYFRYTDDSSLSPRLGLSYAFSATTELHLSYGAYHQAPETFWLNAHPDNKSLRFLESEHVVLGGEHAFGDRFKVRAEIYAKAYHRYPVDSANPHLTLANMGGSIVPTFFGSKLLGVGTGYARGLEVSVQSPPAQKLSWEVNYSNAVVRFKALDGVLRPGDFDYGQIINLGASYNASPAWNISMKWRYAGGAPYTPFDMQLSAQKDTSYFDLTQINTLRYPAYHRLDIRLEKRFSFPKWALSAHLEVQNLYNRKNVYYRFWEDGREQTVYFLPIIPLIALQAEF